LGIAHDVFVPMDANAFAERPKRELLATGEKVNNLPSPKAIPELGVDSRRQLGRILPSQLQERTGTREGGPPKDALFSASDPVLRFQDQYA
jgi:hypothetical protein